MNRDGAIGIFDSGVGGLTVLHAILGVLPNEHLVYLGDTGRFPYGTKSAETVTRYSLENVDFLLEKGVKMLVIACNSASAVALDQLRERAPVPVIGVIEPGAQAAVESTRNGRIGVIGTEATIASGAYTRALRALQPSLELYTRACPLLVPLAEEGWTDGNIARGIVDTYLASLARSGIDTLILGCTHYPLLKPVIGEVMGPTVRLVDSAAETARVVAARLEADGLLRPDGSGTTSFFVTDVPDRFVRIGQRFLGARVESAVRLER
ncbi:MAG TPA: glutamate racemase [Candidatus Binatia bacterium]|jgi:glutamate racemase|nr:glutamate racemase [Candidatus Binatia bacterium]